MKIPDSPEKESPVSTEDVCAQHVVFSLDAFPPLPSFRENGQPGADRLADHLAEVLKQQGIGPGKEVVMPSLLKLSSLLNRSQVTLLEALYVLRRKGYDYHLRGIDRPMVFWLKETER